MSCLNLTSTEGGSEKKRVVVVGGGIAGALITKSLQFDADVVLIDEKEYFEISWASLRSMVEPLFAERTLINHKDYFVNGTVIASSAVNITETEVTTAQGDRVPYDYLVIATGHKDSSTKTRTEKLSQYREEYEMIRSSDSILIVGGGPTGVELAGEIAVDFPAKKVTLVHRGSRLLEFIGPKASKKALDWLVAKKVEVILEQSVTTNSSTEGTTYHTSGGETIVADCHFVCTGKPLASSWLKHTLLNKSLNTQGNLMVDEHLRVRGYKNIFAIGDITDVQLRLQEGGFHADINGDGVLDHVQVVGGNGAEQTVISGSMEVLRPCWAVATSGVPVREQLFNASLSSIIILLGRTSEVGSLEVATPIVIPRSDRHKHRKGSHGDVIFLTNRGEVTSYTPGLHGHDAIWQWQLLTGATWSNLPSPSRLLESSMVVPTLKPFSLRVHDNQEMILAAGDQEAVLISPGGSILTSVDLPAPPTHALIAIDFSNDRLTDLILVTSNGVYGFVQTRQPGALSFSTLVGCLIVVMGVTFVSQHMNSMKGIPRAPR